MIPKVEACLDAPARRRQQDPHHRRPAARTRCCWRSTPTAASARRSCCESSPERQEKTTMNTGDARPFQAVRHRQLHALSRCAWCAARARASGTPRARATSTSSPAGAAACSATVRRASSRRCRSRSATLIHVPNTWYTEPQALLAEALSNAHDFDGAGVLLQHRHRGERGGDQARPARTASRRPLQDHHACSTASTAAPWAR